MALSPISPLPRYEFLDALRGLAILGVISTHCVTFAGGDFRLASFASAGRYGVQLFFMVSAFTIFMTLDRAVSREQSVVRNFFIRRGLRILPMFWVGIVLYAFAPGRMPTDVPIDIGFFFYLLTAILQHGWHPFYINSVVPGGWSIAVEATFYVIAPLLFFRLKNWQEALLFFLISLFACLALNHTLQYLINHHLIFQQVPSELLEPFSDFWFPSQLPVFACGILTFYILKFLPEAFRTKRNGLLLLTTAMMSLYSVVGIDDHGLVSTRVFFALSFLLLIVGLAIHPMSFFVNQATCFLGRISYSVYLMHFLMLQLAIQACHAFAPAVFIRPSLAYALLFVVTVAITIPVSWMTYKFVEQPFIRLGSSIVRRLSAASEKVVKHTVVTI